MCNLFKLPHLVVSMVDSGGVEPVVVSCQSELFHHTGLETHKQLPGMESVVVDIGGRRGTVYELHGHRSKVE